MIQYLLGEMPEPAQSQFEEQFFTDNRSFAQLQSVEDQLIDDYVYDILPFAERQKFETDYLTSDRRRQKLRIAQEIKRTFATLPITQQPEEKASNWQFILAFWQKPVLRYSLAIISVAVVMTGIWLAGNSWRTAIQPPTIASVPQQPIAGVSNATVPPMQATPQKSPVANNSGTNSILSVPKRIPSAVTVLSVLSPGQFRDDTANEASNKIVINPQVTNVTLKLKYDRNSEYSAYRAVIETVSGQKLMNLKPAAQGDFLTIQIPAKTLATEDYVINLSGKNSRSEYEEINDYSFRVVKK